jgi:hypothetical protein
VSGTKWTGYALEDDDEVESIATDADDASDVERDDSTFEVHSPYSQLAASVGLAAVDDDDDDD